VRLGSAKRAAVTKDAFGSTDIEEAQMEVWIDITRVSSTATAASHLSAVPSLREARLAKGYTTEDLAIATGLTVSEIEAAEQLQDDAPVQHLNRMQIALR
jgi:hypothetical protein